MNRRDAMLAMGGLLAGTSAAAAADDPEGVTIATPLGDRTLQGDEYQAYWATNDYLLARWKEAQSIRVGSTMADVAKVFKGDGGIATPTKHRFVMILCPWIKIDVEFDDGDGGLVRYPVPMTAVAKTVSKPYFDPEYAD